MNSLKTRFVKILTMPRVIDSTPEETADYLIGLVLEEAATVVEECYDMEIGAAIRALKDAR